MKIFFKKLLICLLIIVLLFNFLFSTPSQASVEDGVATILDWLLGAVDGIMGIISYVWRIPILILIVAVNGLMSGLASVFGHVDTLGNWDDSVSVGFLGPEDIFFNRLLLTDGNVFKIDSQNMPETIIQIRTTVALWYYIMRIVAISILLVILVYIAIRMSISTIATEKAEYKKMLVNWASSIGLVFLLHYVIVGIATINSTFVDILASIVVDTDIESSIGSIMSQCLDPSLIISCSSIVVLIMIIVQTFAFLIYYIKRMLTISFLIIISPLITITYSIDKLGDGKAQALNTWMKEYFFTVIIQPFHCIIYMAFVSMAFSLLAGGDIDGLGDAIKNTFGSGASHLIAGILAILCIKFVWDAEKIIKNIFGIKVSETLGDAVASAAVAGAMVSKGLNSASNVGKGAKKLSTAIRGAKPAASAFGNKLKNVPVFKSLAEKKDNLVQNISNKKEQFINKHDSIRKMRDKKNEIRDTVKEKSQNISEKVNNVKNKFNGFMQTEGGMKFKRLMSSSAGVAAAMIGGAAVYGASQKTSLFEAGVAGYGAYKGIESMSMRLMNRKKDNYTDSAEGNTNTLCELTGEQNTGDKNMVVQNSITASRLDKDGDLSNSKISDKEKDTRDKLKLALEKRDGGPNLNHDNEIEKILIDLQNGIFLKNLDMGKLAEKYGFDDKEDLRSAVEDFGKLKVYKQMAGDNDELDELAGQDGFYKATLEAYLGTQIPTIQQNPPQPGAPQNPPQPGAPQNPPQPGAPQNPPPQPGTPQNPPFQPNQTPETIPQEIFTATQPIPYQPVSNDSNLESALRDILKAIEDVKNGNASSNMNDIVKEFQRISEINNDIEPLDTDKFEGCLRALLGGGSYIPDMSQVLLDGTNDRIDRNEVRNELNNSNGRSIEEIVETLLSNHNYTNSRSDYTSKVQEVTRLVKEMHIITLQKNVREMYQTYNNEKSNTP